MAREREDAKARALEYRLERAMPEQRRDDDDIASSAAALASDRTAVIESAIQQAIRAGEFDDLPGAGKPLPGLTGRHDPDWWIRRKIETERITGLGPAAFTLRGEDAALDDRLDAMHREQDVRNALDDFNRRVRDARLQLLGGPPVVTPTRDVDAELAAWRSRREDRARAAAEARRIREAEEAALSRRERRRRRRAARD